MENYLIEVFYLGEDQHELQIHSNLDIPRYKLFWSTRMDFSLQHANYLLESEEKNILFQLKNLLDTRLYFFIQFDNGHMQQCAHRILPIAGMYNLRDLGGYVGKDGRCVKWGKVYRGDHLFNLKPEGYAYMKRLGLKSIVDFRSEKETIEYPNMVLNEFTQSYNFEPEGHIAIFAGALQNNETRLDHIDMIAYAKEKLKEDPDFAYKAMADQQKEFVGNKKSIQAYRSTIQLIAQEDCAPLFMHCKGGKDRTGFASMLFLGILGVNHKDIIYDYMLTKRAREKKNAAYKAKFLQQADGDEMVANYLFTVFDTKEDFILSALNEIEKKHQSIENYVKDVLHITQEEIDNMQRLYLTTQL